MFLYFFYSDLESQDLEKGPANSGGTSDVSSDSVKPICSKFLRSDFTSEAKYQEFLKYQKYMQQRVNSSRSKEHRRKKQVDELKELAKQLRNSNLSQIATAFEVRKIFKYNNVWIKNNLSKLCLRSRKNGTLLHKTPNDALVAYQSFQLREDWATKKFRE